MLKRREGKNLPEEEWPVFLVQIVCSSRKTCEYLESKIFDSIFFSPIDFDIVHVWDKCCHSMNCHCQCVEMGSIVRRIFDQDVWWWSSSATFACVRHVSIDSYKLYFIVIGMYIEDLLPVIITDATWIGSVRAFLHIVRCSTALIVLDNDFFPSQLTFTQHMSTILFIHFSHFTLRICFQWSKSGREWLIQLFSQHSSKVQQTERDRRFVSFRCHSNSHQFFSIIFVSSSIEFVRSSDFNGMPPRRTSKVNVSRERERQECLHPHLHCAFSSTVRGFKDLRLLPDSPLRSLPTTREMKIFPSHHLILHHSLVHGIVVIRACREFQRNSRDGWRHRGGRVRKSDMFKLHCSWPTSDIFRQGRDSETASFLCSLGHVFNPSHTTLSILGFSHSFLHSSTHVRSMRFLSLSCSGVVLYIIIPSCSSTNTHTNDRTEQTSDSRRLSIDLFLSLLCSALRYSVLVLIKTHFIISHSLRHHHHHTLTLITEWSIDLR